jgi:transposase-like protein
MNPQELFCPNQDCPSRGQAGQANIGVQSKKERRYRCKVCNTTFAETAGTALYRLHHDRAVFCLVTTLLAWGCPPQAIVAAFGLDERTVAAWQRKAGAQARRVHEHLVTGHRHDLGQVQADEIRVKKQKGIVWMAMALAVPCRLWLGAVISPNRDKALVAALAALVRSCALPRPLLVCFDGFKSYVSAFHQAFRFSERTGKPGRPRLVPWPQFCLGQVVKRKEQGRVIGVVQRLVQGAKEPVEALRCGVAVIHTAYIERLNATFRARLCALVRRGRSLARLTCSLEAGTYLVGAAYNFCTPHASLRVACPDAPGKWQEQTPAMAAAITDHCWSMAELLGYRVPPPFWRPPKKRGRRSKTLQALIERWAA